MMSGEIVLVEGDSVVLTSQPGGKITVTIKDVRRGWLFGIKYVTLLIRPVIEPKQ